LDHATLEAGGRQRDVRVQFWRAGAFHYRHTYQVVLESPGAVEAGIDKGFF
jgi:hypothetical protein